MKKYRLLSLLLALLFVVTGAHAAEVLNSVYSNSPPNATHENVLSFTAVQEDGTARNFEVLNPTLMTVDAAHAIFSFVQVDKVPVAQYFPEETRREIARLMPGINPDALFMSETYSFMPHDLADADEQSVKTDVHYDILYSPGRPVVVVLGVQAEEGLDWIALKAEITAQDTITCVIPQDVMERISGKETLLTVLTVKPGSGYWVEVESHTGRESFAPSKSASDMTTVTDAYYGSNGSKLNCSIDIVNPSRDTALEMQRISAWLSVSGHTIMGYFTDEINEQVSLILAGDVDLSTLMAYEAINVMAVNYQEPYGDVAARFTFPTPYAPDQLMAVLLGMPDDMGVIHWTPLKAHMADGMTEIVFASDVLTPMLTEEALLIVISTPLAE